MGPELRWPLLLLGGWLAGTVSGAAGFGGALLLLPLLAWAVGPKAAIPVLTLAQLLGNVSRAAFGWREIRWRPAMLFSAGAVPAGLVFAGLFAGLPAGAILKAVGILLIGIVLLRHTRLGSVPMPEAALAPAGAVTGAISAIAGSAGPLGAAVFLGLRFPPTAHVATEAVTASLMHMAKSAAYGRFALISGATLAHGLALGAALMMGSWTGKKLLARLDERRFALAVEALLVLSAIGLLAS